MVLSLEARGLGGSALEIEARGTRLRAQSWGSGFGSQSSAKSFGDMRYTDIRLGSGHSAGARGLGLDAKSSRLGARCQELRSRGSELGLGVWVTVLSEEFSGHAK
ncbi:hypothetical protein PoB_007547500 [Plakobranchus ocellatus]|uniref:Uncharacterized protein n=1 Tax=Plakobranchus ocellatus TaxID=259542 RepID=A0AAV4DXR2_9GAST|nr:hypothetical protein PoB_007547500 [Plakobranchus ocellatus]